MEMKMEKCEFRYVDLRDVNVDPLRQRPLQLARARKIAAGLDAVAIGALILSKRDDGRLYALDGQTRDAAARIAKKKTVPALVWTGLTPERESEVFVICNTLRGNPAKVVTFKQKLAYDSQAQSLNAIFQNLGYRATGTSSSPGDIKCIGAFEKMYASIGGPSRIKTVLEFVRDAFGRDHKACHSSVVTGLDFLFRVFPEIDKTRLGERLSLTLERVKSDAKNWAQHSGSARYGFAMAAIGEYNYKLRNKLDASRIPRSGKIT